MEPTNIKIIKMDILWTTNGNIFENLEEMDKFL